LYPYHALTRHPESLTAHAVPPISKIYQTTLDRIVSHQSLPAVSDARKRDLADINVLEHAMKGHVLRVTRKLLGHVGVARVSL
jgi:hypothetical protein